MDRRTFLSMLAGLPFIGSIINGKKVAIAAPTLPASMPGYVSDFFSIPALLEHVILCAKGKSNKSVWIHAGKNAYESFSNAVLSRKDGEYGFGLSIFTERSEIDPEKGMEFSIGCHCENGSSHYKIWHVRDFFRLEHIKTVAY